MRCRTLALSILLALLPAASAGAQDELVQFVFAPADGELWIEEMEDWRHVDYGPSEPTLLQETHQTDELLFEHLTDGGYRLTRIIGPSSMSVGGEPTPNAILVASEGSRLELILDERGRAHQVQGYRKLMRKLERSLDFEEWNRFQQNYSVSRAEASELGRWNDRLSGLMGLEAAVGEVWGFRDLYPTGVSEVQIQGTMRFDGYTELNGQRGLKVLYEFGSGSRMPALEDLDFILDLMEERPGHAPPTKIELHGTRVRVFVPESGQMIYENTQVEWVQPGPPGQPDHNTELRTVYRLRPASSVD